MTPKIIAIRSATAADAEDIYRIHHDSIKQLVSNDYPADAVEVWATHKDAAHYRESITRGREDIYLGEVDGKPLAFMARQKNFLNALYLVPEAKGLGLGRMLMTEFERLVREEGHDEYLLSSTLTAHGFYLRMGYEDVERLNHELPGGFEVACVRMRKPVG